MSRSFGNRLSRWSTRWFAAFAVVLLAVAATTGIAAAAVEVNNADQSQLESVKGIGPSLSARILAARKNGGFKDWSDLQSRVSGVGEKNSAGFSRNGLTVAGRAREGAESTPGTTGGRVAKTTSKKASSDVAVATTAGGKKAP